MIALSQIYYVPEINSMCVLNPDGTMIGFGSYYVNISCRMIGEQHGENESFQNPCNIRKLLLFNQTSCSPLNNKVQLISSPDDLHLGVLVVEVLCWCVPYP